MQTWFDLISNLANWLAMVYLDLGYKTRVLFEQ